LTCSPKYIIIIEYYLNNQPTKKKYIMAKAKLYNFHESLHTMKELAELFGLSYCRMSNLMHQFKHDADTIYRDRNSDASTGRSGKNPKVFAVDLHGNTKMTVAEIAEVTGYSKAAISGRINRGVVGYDLLKKKKIRPLYVITPRPEGSIVKQVAPSVGTTRSDKASITVASKGVDDIIDRQQIKNAVDDFIAAGGKIKKLAASGSISGQSWKEQAKKTWSKRKRKLETRKVQSESQIVTNESGEMLTAHPAQNGKGGKVNVEDFIAGLEDERDQRRAYGEVLHLAASDEQLSELERSLPETAFGDSLEKR
jgi:hypothetical protein